MNSADINAEPNGGLNNAELVNKDSFERLRSKNRHKEFRRKIFYLFVSLLLCAVVGTVCVVFFFGLKHVEVRGNGKYTSDEIIASCGFEGAKTCSALILPRSGQSCRATTRTSAASASGGCFPPR